MRIAVYAPNWIGDAVMAVPMVRATRAAFPDAELTVLSREWVAGVYRFVDGVDDRLTFAREERKSWSSRGRLIRRIRERRFDLAFLVPYSYSTAWLLFRAGVPRRVGYTGQWRSWMLTDRMTPNAGPDRHRSDTYLGLLEAVGADVPYGTAPRLSVRPPEPAHLPDAWEAEAVHVGLNPNSVAPARRWPLPYWRQLIREMQGPGVQPVLFGGPDDRERARELASGLPVTVLDLTGRLSLTDSIRTMAACDLFVSNDSGPMHVADAAGVPTVGLFGAGSVGEVGLRSPGSASLTMGVYCSPCRKNECINDEEPMICMRRLAPERVAAAGRELLEGASG